eukprot:650762-Pyramimonas_sp.AAC.1
MPLHFHDRDNSPGDCFWMRWWGYAKRHRYDNLKFPAHCHWPSSVTLQSRTPEIGIRSTNGAIEGEIEGVRKRGRQGSGEREEE